MMTEEWADIKGFEGLYQISTCGRIRSLPRSVKKVTGGTQLVKGRIKKCHTEHGYFRCCLYKENVASHVYLHRTIAEAFIGPCPEGWHVHHRNGDKKDNSLRNLEYVSSQEHSSLHSSGESNVFAKLTRSQVDAIRNLHRNGATWNELADAYGVSYHTVRLLTLGITWQDRQTGITTARV